MNCRNCTSQGSPTLAVAALGIMVLLLATGCGGQSQPGAVQPAATATSAPTSVPKAGVSAASPSAPGASPSPAAPKPVAAVSSPSPSASAGKWNFDTDPVGSVPAGAQVFSGQWAVRAESDAPSPPNALCQTGEADFPAIRLDDRQYTDLTFVTRFKPISGKQDQAGGLIFRVQDKDNYYIARANALEDNVIFFTYVGARRNQLKGAGAKVMNGIWHELRVDVHGHTFAAFLDGKQVVEASDERYKTGGIGLWTKADSVTCFDDVEVTGA